MKQICYDVDPQCQKLSWYLDMDIPGVKSNFWDASVQYLVPSSRLKQISHAIGEMAISANHMPKI